MDYVMYGDDYDPGFRYEGLARYAFSCNSYGGPNNIAHQSVYNSLFIPETNEEGKLVLIKILNAVIDKTQDKQKIEEFIEIKDSITEGMVQSTAIDLIDYIIKIIQE
jgi:hypothetical protein